MTRGFASPIRRARCIEGFVSVAAGSLAFGAGSCASMGTATSTARANVASVFMTGLLVERDPNAENAPVEDLGESLVGRASRLGVPISAAAAGTMLAYLDRLLEKNEQFNLTGVRDRT